MKKNLLLSALFFLSFACTFAQLPIAWRETFREPNPGWTSNDSALTYTFLPGELQVSSVMTPRPLLLSVLYFQDPFRDFVLSSNFTLQSAASSATWGLFWGGDERERGFALQVNDAGSFRIVETGPQLVTLLPWQKYKKLAKPGVHTLALARSNNRWEVWIDEKPVATITAHRFYGKRQGYIFQGKAQVVVDDFTFRRKSLDFPEAGGGFPLALRQLADSTINTPAHETAPLRAEAGKRLFFTRADSLQSWVKGHAWYAPSGADSIRWTMPIPVWDGADSGRRETVIHAEPNGLQPMLASPANLNTPPVFRLDLNDPAAPPRSVPMPVDVVGLGYTDISLSADGRTAVFSMEKADGYGNWDLYVSFRDDKGTWSAPRNLGMAVNSFGREFSPVLMPDMLTLYFASTGRQGYGEADVYISKRETNTWTQWSPAENLGPGINAGAWNAFFRPFGKGDRAYMASIETGGDDFDIYYVRVPEDIKSRPVVKVSGRVLDKATGQPVESKVSSRDLTGNHPQVQRNTEGEAVRYVMYLPYGSAYQLTPEQEGYFGLADTLDLRRTTAYTEVTRDLYVALPEAGLTVQLERVYFERATAVLLDDSYPELQRLVSLMLAIPTLEIEIRGHTDNIGAADDLQRLSESRAKVIRDYLINQGIASGRVAFHGFGATQPIADNADPMLRAKNRRVEFVVVRR